jgi:hypothetical protein
MVRGQHHHSPGLRGRIGVKRNQEANQVYGHEDGIAGLPSRLARVSRYSSHNARTAQGNCEAHAVAMRVSDGEDPARSLNVDRGRKPVPVADVRRGGQNCGDGHKNRNHAPGIIALCRLPRQYRLELMESLVPPTGGADGRNANLRFAMAGLGAGTFGTFSMLAWVVLSSGLSRHSAWTVPNLFAIALRGPDAYRPGFHTATWSGLALIFAIYGGTGALWGVLWRNRRGTVGILIGAAVGLVVWFIWFGILWKQFAPAVYLYAPDRQLQIGHILWGMALSRSGRYARRIAGGTETSVPDPHEARV